MSTWQIFSDIGNDFRWEVSGRILPSEPDDEPNRAPDSPLPSMADLLLQGCSKLFESGAAGVEKYPMFRTGLGKSVALKESSVAKALSILGDDDGCTTFTSSGVVLRNNGFSCSSSLFQTGSGKMVNISSAGLVRAKTLLGLEQDNEHHSFEGFQHSKKLPATNEPFGCQSIPHSEKKEALRNTRVADFTSKSRHLLNSGNGLVGSALGSENDSTPVHLKKFDSWQTFPRSEKKEGLQNTGVWGDFTSESRHLLNSRNGLEGNTLGSENDSTPVHSKKLDTASKPPPIKFHTAGGRSLSVSSDALKRARSLLGDPELGNFFGEVEEEVPLSIVSEEKFNDASSNKENLFFTSVSHQGTIKSKDTSKDFISPLRSSFKQTRSIINSENICCGSNLIEKFDAVGNSSPCASATNILSAQKHLSNMPSEENLITGISLPSESDLQINLLGRSFGRPLADISNNILASQTNNKRIMTEKKRIGRSSFISPYKRPRCSKFSTPLSKDVSVAALSTSSDDRSCCKRRASSKYPFQVPRVYMKEYFAVAPSVCSTLECLSDEEKQIKPENADKYLFKESGLRRVGAEAFYDMLAHSGASMQYISKEWVANHYKWIVWKLASYERCYPSKCAGKFLTISNVLEELKYRYDREVNHGHRSAIKRILEGDASPSTMLVLCISDIQSNSEPKMETNLLITNGAVNSANAKVELTDGWYSMDAVLDVLLSKQLAAGKLFVGQKLRIWGAGLCGWVGPVSPLEASSAISLLLNINGTFRAHWADRLGFCKGAGKPLAFNCIKRDGGPVPWTIVGVTRIYPVLYKERLSNGGSIVRSERVESRMVQQHNQRCSVVVDQVISEYHRGVNGYHIVNDSESEGAKILKILETAAEPEVLMAEMSPEQLTSFATYKSKLEASRQLEMEKSIEKALAEAGLNGRDVVPFIRVRVVGLTTRKYHRKGRPKEGIITIWNPTEKQKSELVEGQAYVIAGLIPMNSVSETLCLQARGSTTKWQPLSPLAMECFEPFFNPRKSIKLSNLGEIPLSSEFDIAVYVVYVGEVYTAAHQKKQWVFVTDDSISNSPSKGLSDSLLAISFCSPCINEDSFAPINSNLVGSMVGFCNLIKKAKDQVNHLWVAEATENSAYFLNLNPSICSHLKIAGDSVQTWAKASRSIIDKLREKVSFILENSGG